MTHLDISQNPQIGVEGAQALAAALPGTRLTTLVFGPKSSELRAGAVRLDLNGQSLGAPEVTIVAGWLSTEAGAAVEAVDLSNNPFDPSLLDQLDPSHRDKFQVEGCQGPK